jgi:rSAM/selenodomain-associated transferase 1
MAPSDNARPGTGRPTAPALAALVIFAKAPIPGEVKTRLCPPLTSDEAATLHGSMVLDVLERTRPLTLRVTQGSGPAWDRFLACAPSAEHVFFRIMEERHHVRVFSQTGDDLGVRMRDAFRTVFDLGYQKAVLIGTDVPSLSGRLVAQALEVLSHHDVVLGPTLDGGYYLIGLTRLQSDLFAELPWSTDRVCVLTQEKARMLQLSLDLLPPQRDLDTVEDVLAIIQEAGLSAEGSGLKKSQSPALGPQHFLSARTAGVLQSLAERIRARMSQTEEVKRTPSESG